MFNSNLIKSVLFGNLLSPVDVYNVTEVDVVVKKLGQVNDEKFILCPTGKRFLSENKAHRGNVRACLEPWLLELMPSNSGWPLPKYLGGCGDYIVEEYWGPSLTTYFSHPWVYRAHLAHQLLLAAHMFTFRHAQFAFYLTDLTPDNIAVDADGNIAVVDLDDVIVVDRNPPSTAKAPSWSFTHRTKAFSDTVFEFSTSDICSHHLSDHNYYAVCQHILNYSDVTNKGLLHNPPSYVLKNYRELPIVIEKCSKPTVTENRIVPGVVLERLLADIVKTLKARKAKKLQQKLNV